MTTGEPNVINEDELQALLDAIPEVSASVIFTNMQGIAEHLITFDTVRLTANISGIGFVAALAQTVTEMGRADFFRDSLALLANPPIQPAGDAGFNAKKFGDFLANKLSKIKCFIFERDRDGPIGIGTLVSHRLVLTAWHVTVRNENGDERNGLQVRTALDRRREPVIKELEVALPCHKDEWQDGVNDENILRAKPDVALLRLRSPLGYASGHLKLPEELPQLNLTQQLWLAHQQDEEVRDMKQINVHIPTPDAPRLFYEAGTQPGWSGGPAFNADCEFVGFHQGRLNGRPKLVPYSIFHDNEEFRASITDDLAPTYIWSLTGTLDGELVIGRAEFCNAIHEIITERAPYTRGIWIQRFEPDDPSQAAGLGYSHSILNQLIRQHGLDEKTLRIILSSGTGDLFEDISKKHLDGSLFGPNAGVANGETTEHASEKDRAKQLVDALTEKLEATEEAPAWLYFDNPSASMITTAQHHFQLLIDVLLHRPEFRFVIAGSETLSIARDTNDSRHEVETSKRPGIWIERIGRFQESDVRFTVNEIHEAYGLNLAPEVIDDIAAQMLNNIESIGTLYQSGNLAEVAKRLSIEMRARVQNDD